MTIFLSAILLFPAPLLAADTPSLSFKRNEEPVIHLSLSELSQKIPPQTVTLFDQVRGKEKTYRAFPMKAVLSLAFGPKWRSFEESEAAIIALDGYASQAAAAKLDEDGGWLAFEDVDTPGWEPIGRKKASPAPFYLVWSSATQSRAEGYPWPYQIAAIELVRFEKRYPEVVPAGAEKTSPEWRGFELFRGQCLRCHAMNMQGGKIGPDLNAPQSVVNYRTKEWIMSYVRAPSKYRYTEMPDHGHLSDADLEALYAYFRFKAKQPEKSWDD